MYKRQVTWTADDGTVDDSEMVILINALAYTNDDQSPTAGNRVITITQLDDEGSTGGNHDASVSLSIASTVTVAAANDNPTLASGNTGAVTESGADGSGTATASSTLVAADVDGDTGHTWCIQGETASGGTCSKTGTYGSLVVTAADGAWTYTLNLSLIHI